MREIAGGLFTPLMALRIILDRSVLTLNRYAERRMAQEAQDGATGVILLLIARNA